MGDFIFREPKRKILKDLRYLKQNCIIHSQLIALNSVLE